MIQLSVPAIKHYGSSPYKVVLVHGGPGAQGEMAPVSRELSAKFGVLEPCQTALTVDGEIEELGKCITNNAVPPVTLVGYSWGAWMALMLAARHPSLVSKLVLVSCAPLTQKYVFAVDSTRFRRLDSPERLKLQSLKAKLDNPGYHGDKNRLMCRVGGLLSRADSFDPLPRRSKAVCRWDIFASVWPQAEALRRSGVLLAMGKNVRCPVVAIHGDYDPHPADGVRLPLGKVLQDFRFILLAKCGHLPWFERQARHEFFQTLSKELTGKL